MWPLLEELGVRPEATHAVAHAEEDYTANVPLERLRADDVLLAYRFDGAGARAGARRAAAAAGAEPLLLEERQVAARASSWWRRTGPGFWERLGYSNTADPWKEERYGF